MINLVKNLFISLLLFCCSFFLPLQSLFATDTSSVIPVATTNQMVFCMQPPNITDPNECELKSFSDTGTGQTWKGIIGEYSAAFYTSLASASCGSPKTMLLTIRISWRAATGINITPVDYSNTTTQYYCCRPRMAWMPSNLCFQ